MSRVSSSVVYPKVSDIGISVAERQYMYPLSCILKGKINTRNYVPLLCFAQKIHELKSLNFQFQRTNYQNQRLLEDDREV